MRLLTAVLCFLIATAAAARDPDGRWAQSQNRQWFETLTSKAGANCCSDADGLRLEDPMWEQTEKGFRVFLKGKWIAIEESQLVTATNRVGYAMVWPVWGDDGGVAYIRCFMAGSAS